MSSTWQQQLQQALTNQHDKPLNNQFGYSNEAQKLFADVITNDMLTAINKQDANDPILQQFLPTANETIETKGFHSDPVGDDDATQVPGLIHKYHGRVLLIASGSCAVNCRYCFRRHFPYQQSFAPRNRWRTSVKYIEQNTDIHEVILSGGDPLTQETKTLKHLTDALEQIEHVNTLRIHSRIPVVLSDRVDDEFLSWAEQLNLNKVMVLHINHANELTSKAKQSIEKLKQADFTLLNQSVLLKGINDDVNSLSKLSHSLFSNGVLPYYLHQFDPVQNAAHFMVEEQTAISIHQQLKQLLPGYLVPKLVKEVAGEQSKSDIVK